MELNPPLYSRSRKNNDDNRLFWFRDLCDGAIGVPEASKTESRGDSRSTYIANNKGLSSKGIDNRE